MPLYQAAVEKTNVALNRQNIANINKDWFAPGTNLAVAASQADRIDLPARRVCLFRRRGGRGL